MKLAAAAALLTTFLLPGSAFAGGWTQAPGSGYAKIAGSTVGGTAAFAGDGEVVEVESVRLTRLRLYYEHGIRDDLTLVAAAEPLGSASFGERNVTYFGPAMAGFRQRFIDASLQFAIEGRVGWSPASTNLASADADYTFRPSVRTARVEWEAQLGIPLSFGWIAASAGPRWYSSAGLTDEVFGSAQIGFGPFAGFLFDLHFTMNHSFGDFLETNLTGAGNTRYLGAGLGISYWPTDTVGFHVGADSAGFAQANIASLPLQAGVELRY